MKHLALFGSTGSIGTNTLDVVARHPEQFRVEVLVARSRDDILLEQIRQFRPRWVGVVDPAAADRLERALNQAIPDPASRPAIVRGQGEIDALAAVVEVDTVVAAIVGTAGLASTWAAVQAGKRVLLANKESLVAAGALMMQAARDHDACILPVDSEHNAIFQCLPDGRAAADTGVSKLILTASGGPFRARPLNEFAAITPDQACRHPNWSMGRKISVDSATMMNKGLEVIEAHWLFDMQPERIEVAVHPESVVHSMVQFDDGSVLAQLGSPDMRTPIAHALAWPKRISSGVAPLDLFALNGLHFEAPDRQRFPCLQLAFQALEQGGSAPLVLNAANEVAVAAFLEQRIGFTEIAPTVARVLDDLAAGTEARAPGSIDDVLALDQWVRVRTAERIGLPVGTEQEGVQ